MIVATESSYMKLELFSKLTPVPCSENERAIVLRYCLVVKYHCRGSMDMMMTSFQTNSIMWNKKMNESEWTEWFYKFLHDSVWTYEHLNCKNKNLVETLTCRANMALINLVIWGCGAFSRARSLVFFSSCRTDATQTCHWLCTLFLANQRTPLLLSSLFRVAGWEFSLVSSLRGVAGCTVPMQDASLYG